MTLRPVVFLSAFISVAAAFPAHAQENASAILNQLELRELVARALPADHARLAAHFTALADQYGADAKRHESMALGQAGPSGKPSGLSLHCKQLATLNTELQTAARGLAEWHANAAKGHTASPPSDPAGLTSGVGARKPTDEDLAAFAAKAMASGDHRMLSDYFSELARRYKAEADAHTGMATVYRGMRGSPAVAHCDRLVSLAKKAADEARATADMHASLAKAAR
jgi:hypothetical protein